MMSPERRERHNKWQRDWRAKHPERVIAFREKHKTKERSKRYYRENKEKCKADSKQYQSEHREHFNELERKRYNPMSHRKARLKRKYKITIEQVEEMRIVQNNQCAICKEEFTKTPHVDHCHTTGKVRGLLCGPCNRGMGLIGENIEVLQNMIIYLNTPILG